MPKRVTAIVYRYIQEGMYSTAIRGSIVLLITRNPRRIEYLRRYSARKLFLHDGKIEQTVEGIFSYFYYFSFLFRVTQINS